MLFICYVTRVTLMVWTWMEIWKFEIDTVLFIDLQLLFSCQQICLSLFNNDQWSLFFLSYTTEIISSVSFATDGISTRSINLVHSISYLLSHFLCNHSNWGYTGFAVIQKKIKRWYGIWRQQAWEWQHLRDKESKTKAQTEMDRDGCLQNSWCTNEKSTR